MMGALKLPNEVLHQHLIVLGKTGAGKSSVMRLLVEKLLEHGKPVCILDPKGDWWGLKSSADGSKAGYPVVIFGGEHADVPLTAHAGSHVAELVATGNRPCIIDLGGWMVSERTRFFIDFASALFRTARGQRWLVIDEVHNFCPQGKVHDPDAGKMLHWANRLASEGRGKGIQLLAASQRPQKVHKDFVTSCETLIAMRVIHPLDRGAIKEWIDGCPDPEKGKEVLGSLASMPRGTGWAWSPEIGFGPERIAFPLFATYDSFKGPGAGDAPAKLKGWAEADLEEVRTKMAAVVERAKADDPKELRKQIAELQKKQIVAPAVPERIEVPVLTLAQISALESAVEALRDIAGDIVSAIGRARSSSSPETVVLKASPKVLLRPVASPTAEPDKSIGGGMRRIMVALAQRPGLTNRQIGLRAGLSSKSGTFSTYIGRLRAQMYIRDEGDRRFITTEGVDALGSYTPLPEGRDLLAHWVSEMGGGAGRMLQVLSEVYPRGLTNQELGAAANISHASGTFSTYLGRLRTLELVTGRGEVRMSEELA